MKKFFLLFAALMSATVMNLYATYCIAGNGTEENGWCCGVEWQADGCYLNEGSYEAIVPAGTYEFKITDGTWDNSWGYSNVDASSSTAGYKNGNGNVKFTVAEEAEITVIFDEGSIILSSTVDFVDFETWTIAGSEELMGSPWDPADTNNDMTKDGDNYVLVKENVELIAGLYEYKATKDHAWQIQEVPASGNQSLEIEADGTYNITFTLDAEGTTLTAEAELAPTIKYYAKNNWDGGNWEWIEMTKGDNNSYYVDRVVFGGTGVNINTKADDSDAKWFPIEDITVIYEETNTLLAGDTIKLIYNYEYDIVISAFIGRPCKGEFGIKVFSNSGEEYIAGEINPEQKQAVEYMVTGVYLTVDDSVQLYDNCNQAGWANDVQYMSGSVEFDVEDNKFVVSDNGTYDFYFQLGTPDKLYISKQPATAIENAKAAAKSSKWVENNHLYILRNDHVYDAQGRMVK